MTEAQGTDLLTAVNTLSDKLEAVGILTGQVVFWLTVCALFLAANIFFQAWRSRA